jgi:hypothetical protein
MPRAAANPLLTAAREWYDAGFAVIPSHEDGGKRPFGKWAKYQEQRPTWDEVTGWLETGRYTGIGVLTGTASGNAELIEIEGPMDSAVVNLGRVVGKAATYAAIGVPELLGQIARGCVEQSPGGGLHLLVRVTDGPAKPNTKLARSAAGKVVAETRGEGGFVIVAPTPARKGHAPDAAYIFINGGHPSRTVSVTSEERDILHLLFTEALDEAEPEVVTPRVTTAPSMPDADSTFDRYRAEVTWRGILEPAGWTWSHRDGERDYWTRPGKKTGDGISASTIEDGPLYNFSGNAGLPDERGMSKAQVYAHLHHDGDLSAAARALAAAGYGSGVTYADLPAWDAPSGPQVTEDGEVGEPTIYEQAVSRKYAELRVLEDAKGMLSALKAGSAPPLVGVDLATLLAQPDEEVRYRVADLWPAEGRVMLAAAAKSGKTTMVAANLIPSLVDGRPFLGRYDTQPLAGRVLLLNMEVGDNTLRRWMRECQIDRQDAVIVANLRGRASALSLGSDVGRRRFAEFIKRHEAEAVILDPLAPVLASLGLDENSNADVSTFYSWWGEALTLAGVVDDVVVHHTGHAGQRSRGASRLLDEPDAIWTLTREEDEEGEFTSLETTRYLAAYGRDVDLGAEALEFDASSRSLSLTGMGRQAMTGDRLERRIAKVMADGGAKSKSAICDAVGGKRQLAWDRVASMIVSGALVPVGAKGKEYVLPDAVGGAR